MAGIKLVFETLTGEEETTFHSHGIVIENTASWNIIDVATMAKAAFMFEGNWWRYVNLDSLAMKGPYRAVFMHTVND